jgi:hypothetical protein
MDDYIMTITWFEDGIGWDGVGGAKARDGWDGIGDGDYTMMEWVMCIACIERGIHELFELN